MTATFYEAQLGGVRLYVARADTGAPRTLVEQQPTRGDANEVDDRGRGPHHTRVTLLFVDMTNAAPPLVRLRELVALVAAGNPDEGHYFSHPVEGTYRVKIGDFNHQLGPSGQLSASATLVRVEGAAAVTPLGPGLAAVAGVEAVSACAAAVTAELAAVGLESDLPNELVAQVEAWRDQETPPRTIFMQAASASQQIQDEMARLELAADLRTWSAYRQMIDLAGAVAGAAEAATAAVAAVFRVRVETAVALRPLVASIYGGRLAAERLVQVIQLNDVRNPGRISAGTELVMPALSPAPRRA